MKKTKGKEKEAFYKHPCIECGKTKKPIIGQCENCGGPIRECCRGHLAKC